MESPTATINYINFEFCIFNFEFFTVTIKELRQKSEKELRAILTEEGESLRKLRFQNNEGKLRRNHLFSESKKNIARILTILEGK